MIILEKIQGDKALIIEDDEMINVPASMTEGCTVGDVIILSDGKYITDTTATKKRKQDILNLQNSLWE